MTSSKTSSCHFYFLLSQPSLESRVFSETCVSTHQDEAGVVSVPPAEGRHADFWVLVVMENLASAVGVSAEDEPRLKPLQQLGRERPVHVRGCSSYLTGFIIAG